MRKKVSFLGILFVLAAVCLVVGIFHAISRAGFQDIYLQDMESVNYGWKYEIRTAQGKQSRSVRSTLMNTATLYRTSHTMLSKKAGL